MVTPSPLHAAGDAPPRRALVVEGGGMRGAYAAGALVGLLTSGEEFDAVYASSSGACSAAYLHAGQHDGVEIWRQHLHGHRLISPLKVVRGRRFLDLEYLFDDLFTRHLPLDVEKLRAAEAPLWVSVTRARDGVAEYHDARTAKDPLRLLKASAALPIAYGRAVTYEGETYVDGGIADPIPVRRALADGATDVTVVRTKPLGYRRTPAPEWVTRLATRPYPGVADGFRRLHERYNDALDAIATPPPGVRMRALAPSPALRLKRLTTRGMALRAATAAGIADALSLVSEDAPQPA